MLQSAPFELLADAGGSVTFGWADDSVYYARFSRTLSARLGETLASRLAAAAASASSLTYFADARELESYDLSARSAILRVVNEQRAKLERLELLWWEGIDPSANVRAAFGDVLHITRDAAEFERRLTTRAPLARTKLVAKPDSPHRTRWPLRR